MLYCSNCGKQIKETAKFCAGCGTKVEQAQEQVSQTLPSAPASKTKPLLGIIALLAIAGLLIVAGIRQNVNTFTDDRDGNVYKYVEIGDQIWMAENLRINIIGSKCYGEGGMEYLGFDFVEEKTITKTLTTEEIQINCYKYGKLYNWWDAMEACPQGWHLPTNEEWDRLYRYIDRTTGTESPYTSSTAGKYLKATDGWNYNEDEMKFGNGNDKFGFAALPGGYGGSDGIFFSVGNSGDWWSATERYDYSAYNRNMVADSESASWSHVHKVDFYSSIRCVKD